jgi:thiosulfate/3-mercaptopyruvate sulfurtransferase
MHLDVDSAAIHANPDAADLAAGFRGDLERWRHLLHPDWLQALLAGRDVVAAPAADWQLFEVGCDGQALFQGGHIPGARYLDTQWFEQTPYWNRLPDRDLLALLQSLGLGPQSSVILYGRNSLAAARVAQLLLYAGLQDVRLLDGGLAAWIHAGYALEPGAALSARAALAGASGQACGPEFALRRDYLLDVTQTRALRLQPGVVLVSIRSHAEWMGESSGYSYIVPRGEIAGALWGHAGHDGDVNSMSSFQDAQGRMRPATEIAAVWAASGITPQQHTVFYCGTGWRASMAFYYAWLMGWQRISVFDGGWYEWSADAANPVDCRSV